MVENWWRLGLELPRLNVGVGRPQNNMSQGPHFTHAQLGINHKQAQRCQKLAEMSKTELDEWLESKYDEESYSLGVRPTRLTDYTPDDLQRQSDRLKLMVKKARSAPMGTTDQPDVSADALNADAPVNAPVDSPPPIFPQKAEEKNVHERQANRPRCGSCGELMIDKTTGAVSTWYYCENEDCPNQSGLQVYLQDSIELLKKNRDVQNHSVAARANMKDTSGE